MPTAAYTSNPLSSVKNWQLRRPLRPQQCAVTDRWLWLKPAYHGEFHYYGGIDDVWVDRNTLQTLILQGVIK